MSVGNKIQDALVEIGRPAQIQEIVDALRQRGQPVSAAWLRKYFSEHDAAVRSSRTRRWFEKVGPDTWTVAVMRPRKPS